MPSTTALTMPNLLTIIRLLLTPAVAGLMLAGRLDAAAGLFAAVALTDALDGWLARRLGQVSRLGQRLDPLADKALVNATALAAAGLGLLPWWLALLIAARDAVIIAGAAVSHGLNLGHSLLPRAIGKLSTALQMAMLALLLASASLGFALPAWLSAILIPAVIPVVAVVTAASGLLYAVAWLRDLPSRPPAIRR